MGGRNRKSKKPSDGISNLPENIIENILGRLKIRDVIRTSALSRDWRYKWTTLPDLVFDNSLPYQFHNNEDKLVNLVYNTLGQHKGPITTFFLSINSIKEENYCNINRWIEYLSADGAFREFTLEFSHIYGRPYKVPHSLFSCVNLRHLKLQNCTLPSPPPSGFKELTYLQLAKVTLTNEDFEFLIAKCPQLSHLVLDDVYGVDSFNIHDAPKLWYLYFCCQRVKCICLNNTPGLLEATLHYKKMPDMSLNLWNGANNLYSLCNLYSFTLGSFFLKSLALYRLPSTFDNLSELEFFSLKFEDLDSVSSALGLITSCPNLNKLTVITAPNAYESAAAAPTELEKVTKCVEEKSRLIGSLDNLRYVEMKNIIGLGPEMLFIKMILGNSPLLKQMKIQQSSKLPQNIEIDMLMGLLQFPRASTMAEIICK